MGLGEREREIERERESERAGCLVYCLHDVL